MGYFHLTFISVFNLNINAATSRGRSDIHDTTDIFARYFVNQVANHILKAHIIIHNKKSVQTIRKLFSTGQVREGTECWFLSIHLSSYSY
jgi:uncharacterized membrane protein